MLHKIVAVLLMLLGALWALWWWLGAQFTYDNWWQFYAMMVVGIVVSIIGFAILWWG